MFRKAKCFFSRLRNVLFFIIITFSKSFLRGKKPVVSREFFPQDILKLCKKSLVVFFSPKFRFQNWKYLLFISSLNTPYDTVHVPAISW